MSEVFGHERDFWHERDFCQTEKAENTDHRTYYAVKYATARGHLTWVIWGGNFSWFSGRTDLGGLTQFWGLGPATCRHKKEPDRKISMVGAATKTVRDNFYAQGAEVLICTPNVQPCFQLVRPSILSGPRKAGNNSSKVFLVARRKTQSR